MDPTQQVRNGRKPDSTDAAGRLKTKMTQAFPAVPHESRPAEEIQPVSKSKHWRLLYASGRPGNPESGPQRTGRPSSVSQGEEKESSKYKGLCKNCVKSDRCQLPKPEGGVWRCEEYE